MLNSNLSGLIKKTGTLQCDSNGIASVTVKDITCCVVGFSAMNGTWFAFNTVKISYENYLLKVDLGAAFANSIVVVYYI